MHQSNGFGVRSRNQMQTGERGDEKSACVLRCWPDHNVPASGGVEAWRHCKTIAACARRRFFRSHRQSGFARRSRVCIGFAPVRATCGCGGIGRRTRFRFWRLWRGGSSPFTRTTQYGAIRAATGFIAMPWTFLSKIKCAFAGLLPEVEGGSRFAEKMRALTVSDRTDPLSRFRRANRLRCPQAVPVRGISSYRRRCSNARLSARKRRHCPLHRWRSNPRRATDFYGCRAAPHSGLQRTTTCRSPRP